METDKHALWSYAENIRGIAAKYTKNSGSRFCSGTVPNFLPLKSVHTLFMRLSTDASIVSKRTSLTYSNIYSGADQRTHQSSASLAFFSKPPVNGGLPSQRACDAEIVSIWWRHHDIISINVIHTLFRNGGGHLLSPIFKEKMDFTKMFLLWCLQTCTNVSNQGADWVAKFSQLVKQPSMFG